jgi:hypothetical protein
MAVIYSTGFDGIGNTQKLQDFDPAWFRHPTTTSTDLIGNTVGAVYSGAASTIIYYTSGTVALADCAVACDLVSVSGVVGAAGVTARTNDTAQSCYGARYNAGNVQLFKIVAGAYTQLGANYAASFVSGATHRVGVRCVGNQIYATWDGADVIGPVTDSSVSSGYAGIRTAADDNNLTIDNFSVDNLAASDTTPPSLTSPSATATGATTASGSVSTDEANGTLYYLASANATELVATVKAGSSQAVSASGVQNVTVTGLTASTSYYLHFVHRDAAGNDSAVATSAQFTTSAAGDTTNPDLTGSVTFASITQTSYTAQWPAGSDNVSVTGYEYQIGSTAGAWTDAGNNLSAAITGRTAGTTETVYVRAYDAAGLRSTPAISGSVTLLAATASVTSDEFKNNTGTLLVSATIPKVWLIPFGTPDYTNLVTNGAGELVISEAGLSGDYLIVTANADGTEVGVSKATAS